ncbi:site-specific integrase [Methylobacterium sp. WL122]|nr:site-specific integrase [Methylobacterium sp. WL122]
MATPLLIDTIAKRAKLADAKNPYWHGVAGGRGGVSLGYRKPKRGPGAWVVKIVLDGHRIEERLAPADDADSAAGAPSYPNAVKAALEWAKVQHRIIENRGDIDADGAGERPTVASAMAAYAIVHAQKTGKPVSYMAGTFKNRVLSDPVFAGTALDKLTAAKIQKWRQGFPADTTPRTVNWTLTQVRAALNHAANTHRLTMPAGLLLEIKEGTKALPEPDNARRQIFPEADIRRLVDSAFEVDETGDFGVLAMLLAATGARFSQVARITVGDVQSARRRIMVLPAKKGRVPKPQIPIAVPVGDDVIERLKPLLAGRRGDAPLLLRWHHEKTGGASTWKPVDRRPWLTSSNARDEWESTWQHAGMPDDTVMMCFRHSSIVRCLNAGLPVRLVAALHDTSISMIEKHYSAFIVDATEELIRRSLTPLVPSAPARFSVVATSA